MYTFSLLKYLLYYGYWHDSLFNVIQYMAVADARIKLSESIIDKKIILEKN